MIFGRMVAFRCSHLAGRRRVFTALLLSGLAFLVIFAPLPAVEAAETNQPPALSAEWIVRTWDTSDGLPQNTVSALAQTSDGFLWVGTSGGLARFDGLR